MIKKFIGFFVLAMFLATASVAQHHDHPTPAAPTTPADAPHAPSGTPHAATDAQKCARLDK